MRDAGRGKLPMVSTPRGRAAPDATSTAERLAAGWEFRFVAEGTRADEMVELYRQLGFEVSADPVRSEAVGAAEADCAACRAVAVGRFTAIYTRRKRPIAEKGDGS